MALPDSAAAEADGLQLRIAVAGARLRVTLANRGHAPLAVYFAALGPTAMHHDFLRAELTANGVKRTLRFTGARNASRSGLVDLDPADEVTDEIDLAAWATDRINGGEPLRAGEYALSAVYAVAQPDAWSGTLTAGPVGLTVP
jgi:hypothetical protein